MTKDEVQLRREAVAGVLSGEPVGKAAADIGRTERWVRKWVGRYDPADDDWAEERSRAPHVQPRRTPEGTERLVLKIRERLMADPWAQVGATAIAWELEKLGITPPEVWTIDWILRRAGVAKRRARTPYVPKGTPYPAHPALPAPGAVHQADLVGPRHLEGGISFYALNAVDVGRRRSGIEILPTKEEHQVAIGLVRLWARLGVPRLAQFDNGQTIAGRGRSLALPVRLCLALGVRARFIPFGEPWRNAVVEHFNEEANQARRLQRGRYALLHPADWHRRGANYAANSYRTAAQLIQPRPYYLAFYTAMEIHGMLQHPLLTVFVATTVQKKQVVVSPVRFRFVTLSERRFFGFEANEIEPGERVQVATIERTFIDCVDRPSLCGGLEEVVSGFRRRQADLKRDRLLALLYRLDEPTVAKRIGFLLDVVTRHQDASLLDEVHHLAGRLGHYVPLLPGAVRTNGTWRDKKWEIEVNLPRSDLARIGTT